MRGLRSTRGSHVVPPGKPRNTGLSQCLSGCSSLCMWEVSETCWPRRRMPSARFRSRPIVGNMLNNPRVVVLVVMSSFLRRVLLDNILDLLAFLLTSIAAAVVVTGTGDWSSNVALLCSTISATWVLLLSTIVRVNAHLSKCIRIRLHRAGRAASASTIVCRLAVGRGIVSLNLGMSTATFLSSLSPRFSPCWLFRRWCPSVSRLR